MRILGISALYHDSAAALVINDEVVAAAQEERFTRKKHDASLPLNAMKYCLLEAGIEYSELDYVVYYDNPMLTLDRYMHNMLAIGNNSRDLINSGFENMFSSKLWIKKKIEIEFPDIFGGKTKFFVTKHHISHAASAFYPSPFHKAVIITLDGVGEWTTLSIGEGRGNRLKINEEIRYPHSLGLFYSAFTYFCGFKVNSGDYKFMGLAPYGKPVYYDLIKKNIIDIKKDGSFRLNLEYFDFQNGRTMICEEKFEKLFGGKRRENESRITKREMDIAASVQKITEEIIIKIARYAKSKYGQEIDNLCMAGGVALNCVANGKLLKENIFSNLWIQPAAGDAGGALGAALYLYYDMLDNERMADGIHDKQKGSYLGPQFSNADIKSYLKKNGYVFHEKKDYIERIAELLNEEKIIGYFSGRMEFGPRALGARSIIADSRSELMQSKLNLKIKFRESFRPFAPAVIKEEVNNYFYIEKESPYMLLCAEVRDELKKEFDLDKFLGKYDMDMLPVVNQSRSDIPAVTHVDYSARIQTVDGKYNQDFYKILQAFKRLSGCGLVVNTSFNVRGEPIVCSPEDAYVCFMRTNMDVLVLNNLILYKNEQPKFEEYNDWRKEYELD